MAGDWEVVASFPNEAAAEVAKSYLEGAGLRAFVSEGQTATTFGAGMPFAGVKLHVRSDEVERAQRLLAEFSTDPLPPAPEDAFYDPEAGKPDPGQLPAEPIVESEADRVARKALAVTLLGLAMLPLLPLHFYSMYLLWKTRSMRPPVSPEHRWRVAIAWLIQTPIWAVALIALVWIVSNTVNPDEAQRWQAETVGGICGHRITAWFPFEPAVRSFERNGPLGPEKVRMVGGILDGTEFVIEVTTLVKFAFDRDAFDRHVRERVHVLGLKEVRREPGDWGELPGATIEATENGKRWRSLHYLVDHCIVEVRVVSPTDEAAPIFGEAPHRRFFSSLAFE